MEDPTAAPDRRTFTPAIVASAIFTAACAVFAIAFVGARGGLQLPVAGSQAPVAVASAAPSEPQATPATAPSTQAATLAPTPAPTQMPTPAATPAATAPAATAAPTATPPPPFAVPTLAPRDPLLGLPACPDHPGCVEYTIVRGDTLSGIISRYLLDIDVLEALNPGRLQDPSLIVVGEVLFLGRDPLARLDPCPDGEACALYVAQPGDTINSIAARYLLTRDAILDANPGMPRPIEPEQVIKLPRLPAA